MIVMLFNSIRISFTYLHYYLDPAGFIEKLCENKDKPELALAPEQKEEQQQEFNLSEGLRRR